MPTPREVFDRHMNHQLDRDLEVILIQIRTFYATTESPMAGQRS